MNLRQRILTVVAALALLGATPGTGLGYGDGLVDTSSVTVHPGPLTARLTWVAVGGNPEVMCVQRPNGHLSLRVLDERGNASGWSVSMSIQDDSAPDGAHGLTLLPGTVTTVRGNPDLSGHSTFRVDAGRTTTSLLWSVPEHSGDGEYDLALTSTQGLAGSQRTNCVYTIIVNIDGVAP